MDHLAPQRRRSERGIALLTVVAVLVLLTIIATPFLVTMRDGAQRGKALLASSEAAMEAENAFRAAVVHLGSTDDAVERFARAGNLTTQPATPDYDTLDEFRVPASILAGAGLDPESGRVWGVSVEDESGKINVNNAPYTLIGRFFGTGQLADGLDAEATEATLKSVDGLPEVDGIVRIGDEVVRYRRRDGTYLRGLQRGYMGDRPGNGPARKHQPGALVVNEVAFQIAAYPVLARRGRVDGKDVTYYAPYSNLYELRRISDLGVASLPAEQWDRIVDCLTVSSRGVVGQVFGDPQALREPIKAGQDGHKARMKIDNPQRYPLGATVRVSDGANTDYGVVVSSGGGVYIDVVPAFQHDYDAGITQVQSLLRTPVNVNTASVDVLKAMHTGLARFGQTAVSAETARTVAERLVKERAKERDDKLPPGIRSLREYKNIVRAMVTEGALQAEEATACEMSALNPVECAVTRLEHGGMPVTVKSGGVFTVTARAVVLDRSGRQAGRRDFRRLVDVSPQGTSIYEIAGQAELDEVLRATSAKYFTTFPVNVAYEELGFNLPSSRFAPFFRSDRWPSTDREDESASVRYSPSRLVYGGACPDPEHYDKTDYGDGEYLDSDPVAFGTQSPNVGLSGPDGMEPFSAALWFKPYWGGRRTAFILDSGMAEWEDRIALFYDGQRGEMVFRVKDTSNQRIGAEIRYPFDKSTWQDDRWYHLLVSASGSKPGQMSMVIDGMRRGSPTLLTWTTQSVDASATVTALAVEDASSFPAQGSLLLRGPDGVEVMEYSSRSDGSFQVQRRHARMNRADGVDDSSGATKRTFPAGTSVQLYGYSIPVTSVIPEGGGTLAQSLGRFNALILNPSTAPDQWPNPSGGGGATGTGGGGGGGGTVYATGWRGKTITLNLSTDCTGWSGAPGSSAVSAFGGNGSKGYALLVSTDSTLPAFPNTSEELGGSEVVAFEVNGGNLVVTRGVQPPPGLVAGRSKYNFDRFTNSPALPFIPKHTYTDTSDPLSLLIKSLGIDPDGRLYRDDSIPEVGFISFIVPISVEVAGAAANQFLNPGSQPDFTPRTLYGQIGIDGAAEWFRYDSVVQDSSISPNVLLVRDRTADRIATLFRSHRPQVAATTTTPPVTPPGPDTPPTPTPGGGGEDDGGGGGGPDVPPDPTPGGESDAGGGTPDTPPTPPDPGTGEDDGPGGSPDIPPDPTPGGEDDGGGGAPDTPPPPEDTGGEDDGGGGTPDTPPDPGSGGGGTTPPDDGGGGTTPPDSGGGGTGTDPTNPGGGGATGAGGTATVAVPFNSGAYPHFIGRFLDFRSTGDQDGTTPISTSTTAQDMPALVGDIQAKASHAAGEIVASCFLVAFPGIEYDPQGDGASVEKDLDEFVRVNNSVPAGQAGSSTGAGSSATGSGAGGSGTTELMATVAAAPTLGQTGDGAEQGATSLLGAWIEPGPGYNDEVTLVSGTTRETHVVNWSVQCREWTARYDYLNPSNAGFRRNWTFVAFKEAASQLFSWNYDRFDGTTAAAQAVDLQNYLLHSSSMGDPRSFVRLVKSPSGEMPSRVSESVHVAADWNGGEFAPAVIDEVRFATRLNSTLVNHRTFFAGAAPVNGAEAKGIDATTTSVAIHPVEAWTTGLTAQGVRTTGGVIRIEDELIGYSDFDASSQTFTDCERGAFGTEAREHPQGAEVSFVQGIAASRLEEALTEVSASVPLASSQGFPIYGGFLRIGDEILGYTRVGPAGVLEMPEGRQVKGDGKFDPYADSDQGAGLLRGRYGTQAAAHPQGSLAYHLDHRYPDMVREMSDHPQMAAYEVSRSVKGALWKRVSWDERLRNLIGIRVLVRFDGGPGWDSDRIIRLDTDAIPETDRTKYLYQIEDTSKLNLLNVQSDRIQCRVYFTYRRGAWNPVGTTAADAWKETPWLKAFRIEYAAPTGVLTTEDLR